MVALSAFRHPRPVVAANPTRPPTCPPHTATVMVWVSVDGVWRVEVRQRDGRLYGEIRAHGGLVWSGPLTANLAHAELDATLAGLDGPRLAELRELG